MEEEIKQLKKLSDSLRRMNTKLKLISLIEKAKHEYDSFDFEAGLETLEQAYKINPRNAVVLRGIGCIKQSMGDFDSAIDLFNQAIEFSEAQEIEYTLLGIAYYIQDKLDEAVKYFNIAIDKNDDYTEAYEGRNQAMLENHIKILDLQESLKKYL